LWRTVLLLSSLCVYPALLLCLPVVKYPFWRPSPSSHGTLQLLLQSHQHTPFPAFPASSCDAGEVFTPSGRSSCSHGTLQHEAGLPHLSFFFPLPASFCDAGKVHPHPLVIPFLPTARSRPQPGRVSSITIRFSKSSIPVLAVIPDCERYPPCADQSVQLYRSSPVRIQYSWC